MSKPKESTNPPKEKISQKNVENINLNKQQTQDLFHHSAKNIDSSVRPIIEFAQNKITTDFLKLHNTYLLQGFKRKVECYEKFIKPKTAVTQQKPNRGGKPNKLPPQQQNVSQLQTKATPEQVLEYYDCFEGQINLANQRYQKIYKKSEQNRQRLIGCIDRCSGHSKESGEQFEKCAQGCKESYTEVMKKLYTNFYNKFLTQV